MQTVVKSVSTDVSTSVRGFEPGKPVRPPLKKNGFDAAYYLVVRVNGPAESFRNGEAAREAYRVLGGRKLVRVNVNGSEVELEVGR